MTDRPALVRIDQSKEGAEARVVITLAWNDHEYLGEAAGPAGDGARPRLLGEATLRAVRALSDERVDFILEAIATTDLGDSRLALAQIAAPDGGSLVGSALLRGEEPSAAPVRAVLDAINRKLSLVL